MPILAPSPTPVTPLAQEGQDLRLAATEEPAAEPAATTTKPAATKTPVAAVKEETTRASCPGQPEGNLDVVRWYARANLAVAELSNTHGSS